MCQRSGKWLTGRPTRKWRIIEGDYDEIAAGMVSRYSATLRAGPDCYRSINIKMYKHTDLLLFV